MKVVEPHLKSLRISLRNPEDNSHGPVPSPHGATSKINNASFVNFSTGQSPNQNSFSPGPTGPNNSPCYCFLYPITFHVALQQSKYYHSKQPSLQCRTTPRQSFQHTQNIDTNDELRHVGTDISKRLKCPKFLRVYFCSTTPNFFFQTLCYSPSALSAACRLLQNLSRRNTEKKTKTLARFFSRNSSSRVPHNSREVLTRALFIFTQGPSSFQRWEESDLPRARARPLALDFCPNGKVCGPASDRPPVTRAYRRECHWMSARIAKSHFSRRSTGSRRDREDHWKFLTYKHSHTHYGERSPGKVSPET